MSDQVVEPSWHAPARRIALWEGALLTNGHRVVTLDEGYVGTVSNMDAYGRRCPRLDAFDGGLQPPVDLADPPTGREYLHHLVARLGRPLDNRDDAPGFTLDTDGCWIAYTMRWFPESRGCGWTWFRTLHLPEAIDDSPGGRLFALALAWSWTPPASSGVVVSDPSK